MTDKLLPLPEPADDCRPDTFRGDDAALVSCINALLELDAKNALVPHGIGGHARTLLSSASARLAAHLAAQQAEPQSFDRAYWDQRATEHEVSADPEYQQYGAGIRDVLRAMGKAQQAEPEDALFAAFGDGPNDEQCADLWLRYPELRDWHKRTFAQPAPQQAEKGGEA